MASPSVTYSFTNSTTADATQVNQNFTDMINGMSDGTKDFSINAITAAGTATLNGHVIIGNASVDDITFNASVASSIPVKTNAVYDFGAATLAMRSFYVGNGSYSIRILSPSLSASYTLTLPAPVPSVVKSVMTFDTNATATFENRGTMSVVAKTTTYTATLADELILCSGSAFTVLLPASASSTGKVLVIKKTDSSLTNIITIDGNAAETIDGSATTTLNTQYESVRIACDGSNWHIIDREIPSVWNATTNTVTGSTSNPTFGTLTQNLLYWKRIGDSVEIVSYLYQSVTGAGAGSGNYLWAIPTGMTIDTNKCYSSSDGSLDGLQGSAYVWYNVGPATGWGHPTVYSSTKIALMISTASSNGTLVGSGWFQCSVTDQMQWKWRAILPISGWAG